MYRQRFALKYKDKVNDNFKIFIILSKEIKLFRVQRPEAGNVSSGAAQKRVASEVIIALSHK